MSTKEMAHTMAEQGWPVFPVQPGEKRPLGKLAPNGCKDATTNPVKVKDWWGVVPSANIGLATSPRLFVVDLDVKGDADGIAAWKRLTKGRSVPETLSVDTPSGGLHYYFRAPDGVEVKNSAGTIADGIDIRGKGGYVLFPPSETSTGHYRIRHRAPVASAPDWLLSALTRPQNGRTKKAAPAQGNIPEGRRNAGLTSLAGAMRQKGLSRDAMEAALLKENANRCTPPLPEAEVRDIAKSVARYKPTEDPTEEERFPPAEAPPLPAGVYDRLPPLLRQTCGLFTRTHERDVYLLSALTALSACMPRVGGHYGTTPNLLGPNLYLAIVAKAAGGKSAMRFGRWLTDEVNAHIRRESELARARWKEAKEAAQDAEEPFDDPKPPERSLLLPANTSAAAFHEGLKNRNERALVVETEIDTLTNTLGQEWGKFDDTLRKAYHHERTAYRRKGEGRNVTLDAPKLSVVMSGTPGQFERLMGSTENGLYSRFALYYFEAPEGWISQRPSAAAIEAVETFRERHAERVLRLWKTLAGRSEPLRFDLTPDGWAAHDDALRTLMGETLRRGWSHLADVVKRAGVVAYRLAMISAVLRMDFERPDALASGDVLEAAPEDVALGVDAATTLAEHALRYATAYLSEGGDPDPWFQRVSVMLNGVEDTFTSGDAYAVAEAAGLDVSERTLRSDLKRAARQGLIRPVHKNGRWAKGTNGNMAVSDSSDPSD